MTLVYNNYRRYSSLTGFDGNPSRVWISANGGVTPITATTVTAQRIYHGMGAVKHHRRRHTYAFAPVWILWEIVIGI